MGDGGHMVPERYATGVWVDATPWWLRPLVWAELVLPRLEYVPGLFDMLGPEQPHRVRLRRVPRADWPLGSPDYAVLYEGIASGERGRYIIQVWVTEALLAEAPRAVAEHVLEQARQGYLRS